MAQFEDLKLVLQTHDNFEGLRRDMRSNAQAYKDWIATPRTVAQIAAVIAADAVEYQKRLEWQRRVRDTPALWTKLQVGLAALSLTTTELNNIYTELKAAADFQQAATITTTTEITNMSNTILSQVAAHERVF